MITKYITPMFPNPLATLLLSIFGQPIPIKHFMDYNFFFFPGFAKFLFSGFSPHTSYNS